MPCPRAGTFLVLVFVVCQAARDVYFASTFQTLDVFEVTLVAFPPAR